MQSSTALSVMWMRCFQCRNFHRSSILSRYKKKWVEMGRKKVMPRELALSYFDTYYPNVYGEKCWEEMRLALLRRKKKYCALVNNFANSKQTVDQLISEHWAFDIFTIPGTTLQMPHHHPGTHSDTHGDSDMTAPPNTSTETEPSADTRWADMALDLSDSLPDSRTVEYEETSEGFMVPRHEDEGVVPKYYHAPDLYDYVPAVRRTTPKEQLEQDLERQTLMLGIDPGIDMVPADGLLVAPMLKCHVHEPGVVKTFYSPKQDETRMLQYYLMDAASVLPVVALDIRPGDKVLDMCAAPGGKSLAMAQCLVADQIVCLDCSYNRLNRLRDTMRWYVPGVFDDSNDGDRSIQVVQDDGRAMGDKHPAHYDKVLVDVPCNTDRICLHEDENNRFKRTRVTERLQLPQLQTQLLISGLKACKPGGVVVYSTCTLTPGQNDYVVEAAITELRHSSPDMEVVVQDSSPIADRLGHVFNFWSGSKYGQLVLPSSQANFGPAYFAKLVRIK